MTDTQTPAPERIWIMPTRWAEGHGPDIDWRKGGWHTLQAKSPLCQPYVPADALDARDATIAALVEALEEAVENLEQATLTQIAAKHHTLANESSACIERIHAAIAKARTP